jgi:hypothetical protein
MVERLKRAGSLLVEHLHHRVQAQPPVIVSNALPESRQTSVSDVATSPPLAMESDHILVLDQKHWDDAQTLLAQDNPYDSQTAKFTLRHPRNFA